MSGTAGTGRNRFTQLVEMKTKTFLYEPVAEEIRKTLERDEQFRHLLVLSEHARRLVKLRGSMAGSNDPMRKAVAGYGEVIDEELHRRADEIITEVCASFIRQDDKWIVDDPDSFDTTDIQAAFDGKERALRWLNNHDHIVERLDISYPEDN
jgi:hypothetical protein